MESASLVKNGITYITAKAAAPVVGISADYITKLCRKGDVDALLVGNTWYVDLASLTAFVALKERAKKEHAARSSQQLREAARRAEELMRAEVEKRPRVSAERQLQSTQTNPAYAFSIATIVLLVAMSASTFALSTPTQQSQFLAAASAALPTPMQQSIDRVASAVFDFFCPFFSDCGALASFASATSPTSTTRIPTRQLPAHGVATTSAPQQPQQAIISQPVIEGVIENVRTVVQSGIDAATLDARFAALSRELEERSNFLSYQSQRQASDLADDLSGVGGAGFDDVDITDSTFTGGSITGALITGSSISADSITGTISNVISSALATITSFTATELVATNATTTNATTTNLYVSGTASIGSGTGILQATSGAVSPIINGSNGQVLKIVGGTPIWSADLTGGGGGGSGAWATTSDSLAVYPSDPTQVVLVGSNATSTTGNILEVAGAALFRNTVTSYGLLSAPRFTATSSVASVFPYASTTAVSASTLCLSTDCRSTWPTDTSFSTTSADHWKSISSFFSTTSADYWESQQAPRGIGFSTTSANHWQTTRDFFSTTSALHFASLGLAYSTTSADAWKDARSFFSTTSATFFIAQNQGAAFSTTSADAWKDTRSFFSTSSAQYFSSAGLAFSTSSADAWKSTRNFFATTSVDYWKSVTDLFSTTSVNYFVHSSTTLPKVYTANAFTALQTFANASTTNLSASYASSTRGFFGSLSIGNLSGFLKATAGSVAAAAVDLASDVTGILGVARGGTGWAAVEAGSILYGNGSSALATTTAGASGQVLALVGNVPTWVATSTLATISGTLNVGKGGTGATSFSYGLVLSPGGTTALTNIATSSLGLLSTHVVEGSNLYYQDARVQAYLDSLGKGYFFSTTSASHFLALNQGAAFSTTSADAWKDTRSFFSTSSAQYFSSVGLAFSTTSADAWKSVRDFFSTTSSAYFAHSSTTIPKIYTANAFTALQTFANASSTLFSASYASTTAIFSNTASTSNLTISALQNGLLKTNASGVVSLAVLGTDYQNFAYLFPDSATSTLLAFNGGLTAYASSTIGNGAQAGGLTISGGATTTGSLSVLGVGSSYFSGNVGIGTTTPGTKLHIEGTAAELARIHGTTGASAGWLTMRNANAIMGYLGYDADSGGGIVSGGLGNSLVLRAENALHLVASAGPATNGITIETSGRVGIGTTTPATLLDVHGNTGIGYRAGVRTTGSTAQTGFSMFNTVFTNPFTSSTASAFNSGDPVSSSFTGGLFPWTAAGGGLVQIGNSDASGVPAISLLANQGAGSPSTRAAIYMNATTDSAGTATALAATNNLLQIANDATALLTLKGSGSLGIGTTTPATTLSFAGTSGLFASTTATSTFFGGGINLVTSSGNTGCYAVNGTCISSGGASLTGTQGQVAYFSGTNTAVGTSTLFIANNGNVGVGSASPLSNLTVRVGTDAIAELRLGTNAADARNFIIRKDTASPYGLEFISAVHPTADAGFFAFKTSDQASGEKMRITASGNVGIGTSTPQWLLNPTSATAAQLSLSAGSGVAQWAFRNAGGNLYFSTTTIAGTATTSLPAFLINGATGRVGIGTSSPSHMLEVRGDVNVSAGSCYRVNGICVTGMATDVQEFTTAGADTWEKPVGYPAGALVYIEVWGGGGSGAKGQSVVEGGGGGGGAYTYRIVSLSELSSTESVAVGAGGAGQTTANTAGNPGATSAFGSLLSAYGGGGGAAISTGGGGGGGGGSTSAGANGSSSVGGNGGGPDGGTGGGAGGGSSGGGGGGGGTDSAGGSSLFGGGGGGGGHNSNGGIANVGGSSLYGGGGGGGAANLTPGGAAGTSTYGGNGSAGAFDSNNSAAGSQPGGGSGGAELGTTGKGGDGMVRVRVFAGADLAENYPTSDALVAAGDIVEFDTDAPGFVKRAVAGSQPIAGVISSNPDIVIGDKNAAAQKPVALSGRVPVRFSEESGSVRVGDRITTSQTPGVGRKASPFDPSVGTVIGSIEPGPSGPTVMIFVDLQRGLDIEALALELSSARDNASTTSANAFDFVGSMMEGFANRIVMRSGTSSPETSTSTAVLSANSFMNGILARLGNWFADAANGIETIVAKVFKADRVETQELCVDDICVTRSQFAAVFGSSNASSPQDPSPAPLPDTSPSDGSQTEDDSATSTSSMHDSETREEATLPSSPAKDELGVSDADSTEEPPMDSVLEPANDNSEPEMPIAI